MGPSPASGKATRCPNWSAGAVLPRKHPLASKVTVRTNPRQITTADCSRRFPKLSVNQCCSFQLERGAAPRTVAIIKRRELGVHLVLAPDGRITKHGDLAHARLAHASGHNGPSVGVEVVNPYYPYLLRDDLPWSRTIPAPWAHGGAYVLPTPARAEATAQLVAWLTSPAAEGLSIPRAWMGLSGGRLRMGVVPGADQRRPGVYAHHYFAHADGAWLALYPGLRGGHPTRDDRPRGDRRLGPHRVRYEHERHDMNEFSDIANWLQATGPYVLVAILGWAFWRINERKDAALRELYERVAEMGRAQTEATVKVEATLLAIKEAIEEMYDTQAPRVRSST